MNLSSKLNHLFDAYFSFTIFPIFQGLVSIASRSFSEQTDLKEVLLTKIPYEQERVKKFRKDCGNVKIGEVTVDMVSNCLQHH